MQTTQARLAATGPVKSPPQEADDRDLAARLVRLGAAPPDDSALDELARRYQKRVAGLAFRLLGWSEGADDVVQEVFLRVVGGRARFLGKSSLWTFLAGITVNCCRSVRRRQWLKRRWEEVLRAGTAKTAARSDERLVRDETSAQVRLAVGQLPAKYREAIVLRYLEELPIDDVAAALGLSRNAVEVRLSRGRTRLAELLENVVEMP